MFLIVVVVQRFASHPMVEWRVRNCEEVNFSSSDFMGCPSSDFASSEEEMIECLNKIDKVMEEKENYAKATKEIYDVRTDNLNKYK